MLENVNVCLKMVMMAIGLSIGVQSNEHTPNQGPVSASPGGDARSVFGEDRSFWCRPCEHKLRFLLGATGLLWHHDIWKTRIRRRFKVRPAFVVSATLGKTSYEYCWFIIIIKLQAHRWYFKCAFSKCSHSDFVIQFEFAVGFKQYLL